MEEGIAKAEANANPAWLSEAETIILKLAQTGYRRSFFEVKE